MDSDIGDEVMKILTEEEKQSKAQQYAAWCAELEGMPVSSKPELKEGYVADIELQPHWWIRQGVMLIKCRHVNGNVRLMNGQDGPALSSHLPYPVFLAATESFLKGMYLCRYSECRQIASDCYVPPDIRRKYFDIVKKFGHHLPNLIEANKGLDEYRSDVECMRFLNILDALVRRFYYPLHAAEENYGWASARYPKRFYNEQTKHGAADSYKSFPEQEFVALLFSNMSDYLERTWNLRRNLIGMKNTRRK